MEAEHWRMDGFHTILTPHFIWRYDERGQEINQDKAHYLLYFLWATAPFDVTCATRLGDGFLYFRKQLNSRRGNRPELELISYTPAVHLETFKEVHFVEQHVA